MRLTTCTQYPRECQRTVGRSHQIYRRSSLLKLLMNAPLSSFAVSYTGMFAHRIVTVATALVKKIEAAIAFKIASSQLAIDRVQKRSNRSRS